jgi:hypothetical protein
MEGEELVCENTPFPRQHVGPWETPSLAELRERHPHCEYGEDKLTFRHLATTFGVEPLILDPSNAGAVFMVAWERWMRVGFPRSQWLPLLAPCTLSLQPTLQLTQLSSRRTRL